MLTIPLVLACLPGSWSRAAAEQADRLELDGGPELVRLASAMRVERLGRVEVYAVSLYAEARMADPDGLGASDVSKAIRVDVQYDPSARTRIPIDWRRELVPNLNPAAVSTLQRAFAALEAGDVVLVAYVPEKGTAIQLNKSAIVKEGNHDVMLAFLDHWLGQRPMSEAIKDALIAGFAAQ